MRDLPLQIVVSLFRGPAFRSMSGTCIVVLFSCLHNRANRGVVLGIRGVVDTDLASSLRVVLTCFHIGNPVLDHHPECNRGS